MKLSYDWLSDYVNLDGLSPQEVADKITMGAFEVEEVSVVGPNLTGPVIVGQIVDIYPHPQADKIRLTRVRLDEESEPVEIVCGADNIKVGQIIPVALPGAVVKNRKTGEPLAIQLTSIRGVTSNGMLCSPPELGMTEGDSEGILILGQAGTNGQSGRNGNSGLKLGADVIELLSLKPDYILHVEPRSNRGDALSVYGLAREVSALVGRPLSELPLSQSDWLGKVVAEKDAAAEFATSIESTLDCPYFSTRIIKGVKVGPSPAVLVRRLEAVGVRSVNNVVDITNYVMLELGQPLHAYDLSFLRGPGLFVRRARRGEKLEFIDGRERELTDEVLVIADNEGCVGAAGIMGGKGSEITDGTTEVALESACFNSARVRRGSRLLGLSSDSSARFERGVDRRTTKAASDRASQLIEQFAAHSDGARVGTLYQAGSDHVDKVSITLRPKQIKRVLNCDLPVADVERMLKSLAFGIEESSAEQMVVTVPSFRQSDVTRE
ncbi:MAG: phenylalanine--tRNA ligase subunit beta, partial [Cyanobacteria bacterium]|nr:phenylalanine--tRNA ligase subunit beta [Cyanobacteriota bacterium]